MDDHLRTYVGVTLLMLIGAVMIAFSMPAYAVSPTNAYGNGPAATTTTQAQAQPRRVGKLGEHVDRQVAQSCADAGHRQSVEYAVCAAETRRAAYLSAAGGKASAN
jgi:hypothetical protein